MDKHFDFQNLEKKIYQDWLKAGYFSARYAGENPETNGDAGDHFTNPPKSFVLVLPPPNVTGRLHMGHALNGVIQDLLARYHRMQGKDVVWVPGTDHAGIATQTVVKKMLDAEGVDYRVLGREKFVEKIFQWKERYGAFILDQIKGLGSSCDWTRLRFTMDEDLCQSVTQAFVKLYEEKLIYRGKRMVNWCPVDRTALSDDEVETKEGGEPGFLYDIAYPLVGADGQYVVVSTTRPETMFGDVAVAVNPTDLRYQGFLGKKILLPFVDREIPIIADEYVDKDFGSGCLKVTPAHDKNDFEIGIRHGLPFINVMDEGAVLNEEAPVPFCGLSREKCRDLVVQKLQEKGLLMAKHERMVPRGRSYRSKAVIEYRLSEQWFVSMKTLAEKTLAFADEISFHPAPMKKVFLHWLENIEDWCISRQIWWGHQIPAWYHKETGRIIVDKNEPAEVLAHPELWEREQDVLDTWFSSALWPMSVFGWPEKNADFSRYFPTNVLSTAKDIIFFWVARMCLFSVHFEKKLPFKDVCIHPTIVDRHGKTMSKSKGNGIDPEKVINGATLEDLKIPIFDARPSNQKKLLEEVEKFYPNGFSAVGCDALRYTLLHLYSTQQMMQISIKDFEEIGRRFTVKIWNAARFCMMQINNAPEGVRMSFADLADFYPRFPEMVWIEMLLDDVEKKIVDCIENFTFHTLSQEWYNIFWKDFCDWHIELVKSRLNFLDKAEEKRALLFHFSFSLNRLLRFLHPVVPFITEELNKNLCLCYEEKDFDLECDSLVISSFSIKNDVFSKYFEENKENCLEIKKKIELLQEMVSHIRTAKKKYEISSKMKVSAHVFFLFSGNVSQWFDGLVEVICSLAKCFSLHFIDEKEKNPLETLDHVVKSVGDRFEIFLKLEEGDASFLHKNPQNNNDREIKKIKKQMEVLRIRLSNDAFMAKAKSELIEQTNKDYQSLLQKLAVLQGKKDHF